MLYEEKIIETIPVGPLGLIPLKSCEELGKKVDKYLTTWRMERESEHKSTIAFAGYQRDSYIIGAQTPRFGSGEGKGTLEESVRGDDLYCMVDVCNHSLTYSLCGKTNYMSPDDHFQDLKRVIAAAAGKARRINVIMPFLYESRQHKRSSRESLDCALALEELVRMGVENIITFDAHDPRVQNAIPLKGFETVQPIYQFIKHLLKHEENLQIDSEHMMVISPDEGGMSRKVFICATFGLFTNGLDKFDEYYEKELIDRILTTNLVYQDPELLARPYYIDVDMSKYIALIIDNLNHDASLSDLLNPTKRINRCLESYRERQVGR